MFLPPGIQPKRRRRRHPDQKRRILPQPREDHASGALSPEPPQDSHQLHPPDSGHDSRRLCEEVRTDVGIHRTKSGTLQAAAAEDSCEMGCLQREVQGDGTLDGPC